MLLDWIIGLIKAYLNIYSKNFDRYGIIAGIVANGFVFMMTVAVIIVIYIAISSIRGDRHGERFEKRTVKAIKKYLHANVYQNLIIDTGEKRHFLTYDSMRKQTGERIMKDTTEIDIAFATTKGIFVTECKYRSGAVSGIAGEPVWSMGGGTDSEGDLNPFFQNKKHVKALEKLVQETVHAEYHAYNIVIIKCKNMMFTRNGVRVTNEPFSNLLSTSGEALLSLTESTNYSPHKAYKAFREALKALPDVYSNEEVDIINAKLCALQGTKKQRKEHADNQMLCERYAREEEKAKKQIEKYQKKQK